MSRPELETIIGLVAGAMTTSAFVPQALKLWKTRSTQDISLTMFIIMVCGIALWLTFGIMKQDIAIIIPNVASLLIAITILVMKIRFENVRTDRARRPE
jgi:MtN3 and saliva related transmembrane protein